MPRQVCDQDGEVISQENEGDEYLFGEAAEGNPPCATCHGSGIVNPLTAPKGHFFAVAGLCPDCEGTGESDWL
jgi:hypothetical protein